MSENADFSLKWPYLIASLGFGTAHPLCPSAKHQKCHQPAASSHTVHLRHSSPKVTPRRAAPEPERENKEFNF